MENFKKENIRVEINEKTEINSEMSKIEQKIRDVEELGGRIREMYNNEEISKEAQDFLIKLDQIKNGYSIKMEKSKNGQ